MNHYGSNNRETIAFKLHVNHASMNVRGIATECFYHMKILFVIAMMSAHN